MNWRLHWDWWAFPLFWCSLHLQYSTNKLYSEWSFNMHIVDLSSLSNFQKGYSMRLTERVENSIFDITGVETWHVVTVTKRGGRGLGEELIGFVCSVKSWNINQMHLLRRSRRLIIHVAICTEKKKIHRGLKCCAFFILPYALKKKWPRFLSS